ncbi:Hypothetical predicted protein [Xyrichtys novacula]|uniref:Uncharacterized protein n=1 Tax=Xyrichtys novacula TaxID=13765 RepID=A0AAV1GZR6_XYRNO|nr:Hypothetical predicted protein [Xyrichtys novacula]
MHALSEVEWTPAAAIRSCSSPLIYKEIKLGLCFQVNLYLEHLSCAPRGTGDFYQRERFGVKCGAANITADLLNKRTAQSPHSGFMRGGTGGEGTGGAALSPERIKRLRHSSEDSRDRKTQCEQLQVEDGGI